MATIIKKSRQGYRLNISNELKRVESMLAGTVDPEPMLLKRVHTKMETYLKLVMDLDKDILDSLQDTAEVDQEIGSQQSYHEQILEKLLLITELIDRSAQANVQASAPSSGPPRSASAANTVRLPKFDLPSFSGEYLQWQGFFDMYQATIHDNAHLSKIQKFTYLLGCLEGDALSMVQGYQLTEVNYTEAIEVLKERYGDKQRAKFGHFEALVALKPGSLDSKDLQRLYYECEKHIRSLVALGVSEQDFAIAFIPIIMAKLPSEIKREVWSKNGDAEWTMANLRLYLKTVITARERGDTTFAGLNGSTEIAKAKNSSWVRGAEKFTHSGSASMLVAATTPQKAKKIWKCRYCGDPKHRYDNCTKIATLPARKAFVIKEGLCFRCLNSDHIARECTNQRDCFHCGAKGHHSSLCAKKLGDHPGSAASGKVGVSGDWRSSGRQTNALLNPKVPSSHTATTAVAVAQREQKGSSQVVFLQTAWTSFQNERGDKRVEGRILMDTASSRSYVTEELCQKLQLPVIEESFVSVGRFGTEKRVTRKTKKVEIHIRCTDGTVWAMVANVTPVISSPISRMPIDVDRYPVVRQLPLAEPLRDVPDELMLDVLIGSDNYYRFVNPQSVITCEGGPVLVGSKFGFLTAGTMAVEEDPGPENTLVLLLSEAAPGRQDPLDHFDIERFWKVEEIGTKRKEEVDVSDEKALSHFYSTLKFENGRYWVTWPWKTENPDLADNRKLAFARLRSTYARLQKDPEVMKQYDDTIRKQIELNVVELAPSTPTGPVYYVPHHEVLTPLKTTTKLRVVYDASSKAKKDDLSLNDCMRRGLVVLDDLAGLLLRFRTHPIGIVADIEKAFLQIGLQESERDVTRFFWVKDTSKPITPDNVVVYRFTRVFFGAIGSPSLLGCTLNAHSRKVEAEAVEPVVREVARKFRENTYSDNHISGSDTVEKAARHCHEAKRLCQGASMNLREFYTNSDEVRNLLDDKDRGREDSTKVLGVRWKLNSDTLSCCGMKAARSAADGLPTKRSIVREVAQVFDPAGWLSPVTAVPKMLIQDLWKSGMRWDDPVGDEMARRWRKVRDELADLPSIEIPRSIGQSGQGRSHELHVFCDASQKMSAAAVYWRAQGPEGKVTCDLVCSKTRLAPIEPSQTIPRLELVAVGLGVRLVDFAENQLRLPISRKVVWSDSQCVLQWLKNERLTTKFVKSRVEAINSVPNLEFRYVASHENPADLPSRGCTVSALKHSELWWHGPDFLLQQRDSWPGIFPTDPGETLVQQETTVVSVAEEQESVLPLKKFSRLTTLLRVTAYVKRACRNFRMPEGYRETGFLCVAELAAAQSHLERIVQAAAFPEAVRKQAGWYKQSPIKQLNVYDDTKGILRCTTRLDHAGLPKDAKNPILLPKNHHFTALVIRHAHETQLHAGIGQTVAEVRKRYWIIHTRSQVKKVLRECRKCRRVEGGQYKAPPSPALPSIRVAEQAPFAYTGLDYLGPLLVKLPLGKPNAFRTQKVWICLFTCALVRAIHLEVVENQSAAEFQLALRRFFALVGKPLVIVSDNASQFIVVEKAMRLMDAETEQTVGRFAANHGIQWKKIPEVAPWMGGFYERIMVGTVKRFLKKSLDGICVHISELRTVVAEIAAVVNTRPLLYVEDEASSYVLSPADFLGKLRRTGYPSYDPEISRGPRSTVEQVMHCWERSQALSTNFWDMWKFAYLTSLREKYSNARQRNPSELVPALESVVQIKDKVPRGQWKLGKIVRLIESHDKKIRSVALKLANGKIIIRPLRNVYPLELGSQHARTALDPQGVVRPQERAPYHADSEDAEELGFSQNSVEEARVRLERACRTLDTASQ